MLPGISAGADVAVGFCLVNALASVGMGQRDTIDPSGKGIRIGEWSEFLTETADAVKDLSHFPLGGIDLPGHVAALFTGHCDLSHYGPAFVIGDAGTASGA